MTTATERFVLKDVNREFWSCGHYPEWKVIPAPEGVEGMTRASAEALARKKNRAAAAAWRDFLDA